MAPGLGVGERGGLVGGPAAGQGLGGVVEGGVEAPQARRVPLLLGQLQELLGDGGWERSRRKRRRRKRRRRSIGMESPPGDQMYSCTNQKGACISNVFLQRSHPPPSPSPSSAGGPVPASS